MSDITLTSWSHFSTIADTFDVGVPGTLAYVFRGQSDATWQLVPTLTRLLLEKGIDEVRGLQIEQMNLQKQPTL
jgi:hypothetical protein